MGNWGEITPLKFSLKHPVNVKFLEDSKFCPPKKWNTPISLHLQLNFSALLRVIVCRMCVFLMDSTMGLFITIKAPSQGFVICVLPSESWDLNDAWLF